MVHNSTGTLNTSSNVAAYEFGPFRLEPARRRLLRGGETVALTGRAFDLLVTLVELRDRVVSKDELMSLVWADAIVEEANLSQHIFLLRKLLGDRPEAHDYIATVARRGYRFVAPVAAVWSPIEHIGEDNGQNEPTEQPIPVPPQTAPPVRVDAWTGRADLAGIRAPKVFVALRHRERLAWIGLAILLVADAVAVFVLSARFLEQQPEQLTRATLLPPDGVTLVATQPPVIAPDGRRVAIVGTEPSGKRLIWIRALDSQGAYSLPGTDRASWPFWSPDGRTVGFFADGMLMIVGADGNATPQTICPVNFGFGASWSAQGRILFAPSGNGGLYEVSARGGRPSPVTTIQAGRTEIGHTFPQFLDHRHFIFYLNATQSDVKGTYVADVDDRGRPPVRILPVPARFVQTPANHGREAGPASLLFVRGSTLMMQPFDTATLRLRGDPAPIAQRVAFSAIGNINISASSTGAIVYTTGDGACDALVWFDRFGKRLGTLGASGEYRDPAFSPDGRTLAVSRAIGGVFNLWLVDVARSSLSRFTFEPTNALFPIWSPEGRLLTFTAPSTSGYGPHLKAVTGANAEQRLAQEGNTYAMDWSPDGRFLLVVVQKKHGNFDVSYIDVKGDQGLHPFVTSDLDERSPKFSPDGHWVAYAANESGTYDVFVRSFPDGNEKHQISTQGGARPLWRRDGHELFYLGLDGTLMAVPVRAGATFEWEPPRALFQTPIDTAAIVGASPYTVAPDGERFLFVAPAHDQSASISLVLNWPSALPLRR
jgi:DNA-binding winged helix-turn-helix (wHTH) protein/Tol biopolymer transport system component